MQGTQNFTPPSFTVDTVVKEYVTKPKIIELFTPHYV